jgi:glucose-6-phosphate 1-dehydrogenase
MDHDEFIRRIRSYIKTPTKDIEQQLEEFCNLCSYVSGQYDKDESFLQLNKHLEDLEQGRKENNRLFYMALPPSVFTIVSQHLKKCCYPTKGVARVIVRHISLETFPPAVLLLLTKATGRKALRQGPG